MSAPFMEAAPVDLADLVGRGDIECECMLCHLPLDVKHGLIEWKFTFRFPGPYPEPGVSTMLLCDECYRDWVNNPDDFGGFPESSHKV